MNNQANRRCQPIERRNIRPAYSGLANNQSAAVLFEQTRCLEREKRQNFLKLQHYLRKLQRYLRNRRN